VRDISHEDTQAQSLDVEAILSDLGIKPEDHERIIEVWNKLDLLDENARVSLNDTAKHRRAADRKGHRVR
jgi:GTP-binding protein HflX